MVPLAYTAGDNDLRVQLQTTDPISTSTTLHPANNKNSSGQASSSNQLRISTVDPASKNNGFEAQRTVVATLYIYPDPYSNVTQIVIPCHHLSHGGIYELEVLQDELEQADERLKQQLNVR